MVKTEYEYFDGSGKIYENDELVSEGSYKVKQEKRVAINKSSSGEIEKVLVGVSFTGQFTTTTTKASFTFKQNQGLKVRLSDGRDIDIIYTGRSGSVILFKGSGFFEMDEE